MRAAYVPEPGGIDAIRVTDLPDPTPAEGQLLVRVAASGVNFAETRMRAGTYGGVEAPLVLGMESAGTVEAVGPEVAGWTPGDRVFGRARGSHAELVTMWAKDALPLPEGLAFEQAAAVPVGWLTAWHALTTVCGVEAGERVLVEAVGGSVGHAALLLARHLGCWVAGTASRASKLEAARRLGADLAIDYTSDDVAARVREATEGDGADVALVTLGGEEFETTLGAMGNHGRVAVFGSTLGRRVCFDLALGSRNVAVLSMSITTSERFYPETMVTFAERVVPALAAGELAPVVDRVLPLDEIGTAHRMIADRDHFGKIVLRP